MKYTQEYIKLIRNAKRLSIIRESAGHTEYLEKHHIIPKCVMKLKNKENIMNQSWNLVLLTPTEHFTAHELLYKIAQSTYGDDNIFTRKLLYAWSGMYMWNREISPEEYSRLRMEWFKNNPSKSSRHREAISKFFKGRRHTKEHIKKRMISRNNNSNPVHRRRGADNSKAKTYKFTKSNGEIIVHKSLNHFAELYKYNRGALHRVMTGKLNKHKDIVRVEKL